VPGVRKISRVIAFDCAVVAPATLMVYANRPLSPSVNRIG